MADCTKFDRTGDPPRLQVPDHGTLICRCGRPFPIDKDTMEIRCPCGMYAKFGNVWQPRPTIRKQKR